MTPGIQPTRLFPVTILLSTGLPTHAWERRIADKAIPCSWIAGLRRRPGMTPAGSVQPIQPRDVLVGDLLLHAGREAGEVAVERLLRVRPDAVRVRVVGAPDDVVFADQRHDRLEILVLLVGDVAPPAEILAPLPLAIQTRESVLGFRVYPVVHIRKP